jgi:hypothetical protein
VGNGNKNNGVLSKFIYVKPKGTLFLKTLPEKCPAWVA